MRSTVRRTITLIAAVCLTTLTVAAVSSGPAHAASGQRIHLDSYDEFPPPGQNLGWIVTAVNEDDDTYHDLTLRVDLYEAEGELPAVRLVESRQDLSGCVEIDSGRSFECPIAELRDEADVDFELELRDDADRVNHGVTTAEAVLLNGDEEMARAKATLDASLPLDGSRVGDLDVPDKVAHDQVFGDDDATGAPMSFTVHNDTGTALRDASLFITLDERTGIVAGSDDADCTYDTTGAELGCAVAELAAGQKRTYDFTLWAADADAWKTAEPGEVGIDIVYLHNGHEDDWAHASAPVRLAKPTDGSAYLPVTGSNLTVLFLGATAALLAGSAVLLSTRRRSRAATANR